MSPPPVRLLPQGAERGGPPGRSPLGGSGRLGGGEAGGGGGVVMGVRAVAPAIGADQLADAVR